jgi:hypothetical protein
MPASAITELKGRRHAAAKVKIGKAGGASIPSAEDLPEHAPDEDRTKTTVAR